MKKYINGAITIIIIIAIVLTVKTLTFKSVSLRSFVKTGSVERLWGELGSYDQNGEFIPEKTFEPEDISLTMNKLGSYKLTENKGLTKDTSEGMGEIRFYLYINPYETDIFYVTEDGKAFTDVRTYIRSYTPHDENLYQILTEEFFNSKA